jgi:hypothetical protein
MERGKPMKNTKKIAGYTAILLLTAALTACEDAKVVSRNLSKAADMFEIDRRVVFYNGITGEYMLTIEGRCSIKADKADRQVEVTCKTGADEYKKHFLGLSDNVTYFAEQVEAAGVSAYHYRVVFKPQSIIPDVDFRGDAKELIRDRN